MAGLVAVCLVFAERGQVLCNVILVAVPLILSFVYLDEKPSSQHMTVYWSCFGLLTVLDGALEEGIPFYYIIKVKKEIKCCIFNFLDFDLGSFVLEALLFCRQNFGVHQEVGSWREAV